MLHDIDLRALADMETTERAFVSCYLTPPDNHDWLRRRENTVENMLEDEPDALDHFQEGMKLLWEWLDAHKVNAPAGCVFACYALDFVQGHALPIEVTNRLRLGAGPLIRPIAELQDEHEDFVIVVADNSATRIHFVSSAVVRHRERIKGGIKNQVKKGGWSQKRYQRRREHELLHYAKDIAESLNDLHRKGRFGRLILLGSQETRQAIREQLSDRLAELVVGDEPADLDAGLSELVEQASDLSAEAERMSEQALWKQIKAEYLSDGLAATGPDDVLAALMTGRADEIAVLRDLKQKARKCQSCENVMATQVERCPYCRADSLLKLDLVEEVTRQAERTSARVDFTDPIKGLEKVGGIAALLRY